MEWKLWEEKLDDNYIYRSLIKLFDMSWHSGGKSGRQWQCSCYTVVYNFAVEKKLFIHHYYPTNNSLVLGTAIMVKALLQCCLNKPLYIALLRISCV